jgi:energy-coupling factor transporter ATP-binding protein EcfA2
MLKPSGGAELSDSLILILGAPGAGKTTLAVTASEFMPDKLPAEKFTDLSDVVVIGCDEGATDGLASLNLGVKLIDFNAIDRDLKNPTQSMNVAIDLACGSGAKICVWDTVSKFDMLLNAWLNLESNKAMFESEGKEDKFKMFRYILATYQVLMTEFRKFKGLRIANFHAKAMFDDLTKDATQKDRTERADKAQGVGGMASLVLDVSGRARDLWGRDASLILGVRQIQAPGGKLQRQVITQFDANADMLVKNRFESRLPAQIEPNLRKAINTIRGA